MGNPALKPEVSFGGQLGLEWTPPNVKEGPIPTFRLTGHYTRLTNLIQAIPTPDSTLAYQGGGRGLDDALHGEGAYESGAL